jgi:CSLREA domain-containing protein
MNTRQLLLYVEPLEARTAPATFVVNSLNDGPATVDGKLTLREAILAATTNQPSGDAPRGDFPHDSITFAPALQGGTIAITSELLIDGGGALSITGPGLFDESISIFGGLIGTRILRITAATESVTLEHLAIKNGAAIGSAGGGIHNATTLSLNDVLVSQNIASDGAGIFNTGGRANLSNAGGMDDMNDIIVRFI